MAVFHACRPAHPVIYTEAVLQPAILEIVLRDLFVITVGNGKMLLPAPAPGDSHVYIGQLVSAIATCHIGTDNTHAFRFTPPQFAGTANDLCEPP